MGIFTDLVAKGRNFYTLLAYLIVAQLSYVIFFTVYEQICIANGFEPKTEWIIGFFGYFTALTNVVQLQSIPLYVAARYRDLNSAWELPLAGQMLATAQVCILMAPCCLAPTLFQCIKSFSDIGQKIFIIFMMTMSILPLVRLLYFEAAQRRVNKKRELKESRRQNSGDLDDIDTPHFGGLQQYSDEEQSEVDRTNHTDEFVVEQFNIKMDVKAFTD